MPQEALRESLIAVARIGELVTKTLDIYEILREIVQITAEIMKVDVCSIYLIDPDDGMLVLEATVGLNEDAVGKVRINPGEGITGRAAKQGRMVAVDDVTKDMRNLYFPITGEDEYKSLLSFPLKYNEDLIGVLNVQTREPRKYQKSERSLLKTIATQVSGALHNAILYENVLDTNKQLEQTHQRLLETEKMAALGRLATTISHELRNPLAGLKGAAQLLARKTSAADNRKEYVALILDEIERLDAIIDDLMHFARPRAMVRERFDMNKLIENILSLHQEDMNRHGITVHKRLSLLPLLYADADKLKQVLVNSIVNARDAMPNGGDLIIMTGFMAGSNNQQDKVIIQIADTGEGVDDEVIANAFEPFYTTKPTGVGLGLAICKSIIDEHEGDIRIEHADRGSTGTGTRLVVEIPVHNHVQSA